MALVSVIIPCREVDNYVKRCVKYCEALHEKTEILVIPDSVCPGYPAAKRNYAMKMAKGTVYAFIDSDAFPDSGWLRNALEHLKEHDAVCGPGVLPHDAPLMEDVADMVYGFLPYSERVHPAKPRLLSEYPTFNLVVKKKVATPFDNYLTGEDTLFCRRIKSGIYYHPSILVFHHRRPAFKPLWKQVGTYGRHRGNFIKLALFAWISSVFTYTINFFIGFFKRRP